MINPSIQDVDGCKCIEVIFSGSERPYSSYGNFNKRVVDRSEKNDTFLEKEL